MDLRLHPCSVAPAECHEKCGPNRPTPTGYSCNNAPTRFLHDCRRTAARNLIRASVPERINVASILDSTRELGIRDAQVASEPIAVRDSVHSSQQTDCRLTSECGPRRAGGRRTLPEVDDKLAAYVGRSAHRRARSAEARPLRQLAITPPAPAAPGRRPDEAKDRTESPRT